MWTIVVAGGSGARFGGPKQFESLRTERVIDRSVRTACAVSDGVVVVVPVERVAAESSVLTLAGAVSVVAGGSTRSASVRCGLAAVADDVDVVCIHDAARPMATPALYRQVIDAVLAGADGAIPGIAVTDTVKIVDSAGWAVDTPDRASLRAVQTPQAFRAATLRRAHDSAGDATDDAALVEALGGRVRVVDGEADNRKLTVPSDLDWARSVIDTRAERGEES